MFCLSVDEAAKYFVSDDDRKYYPTIGLAKEREDLSSRQTYSWWLRTMIDEDTPASVRGDDAIYKSVEGWGSAADGKLVRPAVWIKLS